MKIKTLTPAQQQFMTGIRDKWIKKLLGCNTKIDRLKAAEGINWLYEFSGLEKPMIIYVDSPLACQYAVQFIKSIVTANTDPVGNHIKDQVGNEISQIWYQIRDQVVDHVWDQAVAGVRSQVMGQVRDQVGDWVKNLFSDKGGDWLENQVRDQLVDQVRNQFGDQLGDLVDNQPIDLVVDQEYYYFSNLGNMNDYDWLAFYDYFKRIGLLQHENFDKLSNLIDSGINDMIQIRNFCIVSELPAKISRNNQNRFHCESGSAIEWADGYSQYYWNGIPVTKKLIETPHLITKEDILKESKEVFIRCFYEKLGVEEYYNRLGDVTLIDKETDDQGNMMKPFKIKALTPTQQELIPEIRDKWRKKLLACNKKIDRAKATKGINWVYEFSGLQKPIIVYVDSPLASQYAVHYIESILNTDTSKIWQKDWGWVLLQIFDQLWHQISDQGWDRAGDQIREEIDDQVGNHVRDQFGEMVWVQVRDQVVDEIDDQILNRAEDQIKDQIKTQVKTHVGDQDKAQVWNQKYYHYYIHDALCNYGAIAFYDFFKTIGVLQNDNFDKFLSLVDSEIFDIIQLKSLCIVSELPVKISKNNQSRLHCEDGPAIEWADGYCQYYWNGVPVNKKLIETPHLITKKEILKESNAEVRRCIREKLGVEEYYNRLGGIILIDEDTDDQGNIMKLFRSKEKDAVIKKHVQYLHVICPTTKREYILYPPNQKSKNVWDAKASTFLDEKIQYRHGDVGLLNVNEQFLKPLTES